MSRNSWVPMDSQIYILMTYLFTFHDVIILCISHSVVSHEHAQYHSAIPYLISHEFGKEHVEIVNDKIVISYMKQILLSFSMGEGVW